jgi:hypothetical protein
MISLDAVREEAHRYLMTALARNGQRGAALSHYETYREIMHGRTGRRTGHATTTQLRQQIRNNAMTNYQCTNHKSPRRDLSPRAEQTGPLPLNLTFSLLIFHCWSPHYPSQPTFSAGSGS